MKQSKVLWGLAALNLALGGWLFMKLTPDNTAHAQLPPRGEYLIVPGKIPGANNGAVFIVDTRNEGIGGFVYDDNQRALRNLPPVDLKRIFQQGAGGVRPGGGGVRPR